MKKIVVLTIAISMFIFSPLLAQDISGQKSVDNDELITLDVKDMEITDVIRMIADQSGLNIVTSKNVHGKISIDLEGVDVESALDAILKVNNCTYIKEDNIIQVYTLAELRQQEQFARLTTRVYTLNHIKAADLKPLLISLKSEQGKIEIEPKTNRVVVTDSKEHIRSIEEAIEAMDKALETRVYRFGYASPLEVQKNLIEIIPQTEGEVLVDQRTNSLIVTASPLLLDKIDILVYNWDRQIPQVLIEAKIMEMTLQKDRVLGFEWQYKPSQTHSMTIGAGTLPLPSTATYVEAFKIGLLTADEYEVTLKALEETSDASVISSPRIVAVDNEEAKILIGSSEPYEVTYYDSEGRITSSDLKFIDVGIKLLVTPKIAKDGFITMKIHPEVSSAREGTVTSALAIDTTEATTVMRVKDGNTVVLGGLIKDQEQKNVAKIPLLGDIPIIKYLFRSTYTKNVKKEIIIFITPRILTGKEQSALSIDDEFRSFKRDKVIKDTMQETLQKAMEE